MEKSYTYDTKGSLDKLKDSLFMKCERAYAKVLGKVIAQCFPDGIFEKDRLVVASMPNHDVLRKQFVYLDWNHVWTIIQKITGTKVTCIFTPIKKWKS